MMSSSVKMEHAFRTQENATADLTVPTDPMKSIVSLAEQTNSNAAQESALTREEDVIVTLTVEMEVTKIIVVSEVLDIFCRLSEKATFKTKKQRHTTSVKRIISLSITIITHTTSTYTTSSLLSTSMAVQFWRMHFA